MQYFKNVTLGASVVMGRKTAESLPASLPGRKNYVMTNGSFEKEGFISVGLLDVLRMYNTGDKVWIIGGAEIIDLFLTTYHEYIDTISHTEISEDYFTDKFEDSELQKFTMPELYKKFTKETFSIGNGVNLNIHSRDISIIPKLDRDYLEIGKRILLEPIRVGRNGNIRSSFAPDLFISSTFDLGFPILRTKQVWWKGIKEELDFFLSGKTDTTILEKAGVKIWTGNTSEKFLEDNGKTNLSPGDMGPMYGFQWRHFGEEYHGTDYDYKGVDQIQKVINTLAEDPYSRRILMTTYNPAQVDEGVLAPCHGISTQFYVDKDDKICVKTYQRSADWFLGVPFNISSYALLLDYIVKNVNVKVGSEKYTPGTVTTYFGDAHIYESHVPIFAAQYVNSLISDISTNNIELNDKLDLVGYKPERKFTAPMVS